MYSLNPAASLYRGIRESFTQASILLSIRFSPLPGLSLGVPFAVPADGDTRGSTAGSAAESLNRNTAALKASLSPRMTAYRPRAGKSKHGALKSPLSPRMTVNHRRLMRINSANQCPIACDADIKKYTGV